MQLIDGRLSYSATDLVGFLECGHLATLERAAVEGHLARPVRADPVLDRIAQRGREHETRFTAQLTGEGATGLEITSDDYLAATQRVVRGRDATLEAMRAGAEAIYQAVLFDDQRLGYADFCDA